MPDNLHTPPLSNLYDGINKYQVSSSSNKKPRNPTPPIVYIYKYNLYIDYKDNLYIDCTGDKDFFPV